MLVNASYARLYTTFTSLRTIGYVQNRHPINAINVICLICSESSLCKVVDISMNKIVVEEPIYRVHHTCNSTAFLY